MDQTLPHPQKRLPKALAVITGIIALIVVLAWFAVEYSDVLWPDQAYLSAWYLGSDAALYELKGGELASIAGMPEGVIDAARAGTSYALIVQEGTSAYVSMNGERIASGPHLRDVALSPDGTQVAFARSTTGASDPSAWEVVRIVGAEERVIAPGFSPYFLDGNRMVYVNEKGAWLQEEGGNALPLSGVAFSDVTKSRTTQSPDRIGLALLSDTLRRPFVFTIPSVEPLEFKEVPLIEMGRIMPVVDIALSDGALYALHSGSPTPLWIHTMKHPEGRFLTTLSGVERVTDIIFAP